MRLVWIQWLEGKYNFMRKCTMWDKGDTWMVLMVVRILKKIGKWRWFREDVRGMVGVGF